MAADIPVVPGWLTVPLLFGIGWERALDELVEEANVHLEKNLSEELTDDWRVDVVLLAGHAG